MSHHCMSEEPFETRQTCLEHLSCLICCQEEHEDGEEEVDENHAVNDPPDSRVRPSQ